MFVDMVALSEEEKQKIIEEERIRAEERAKYSQPQKAEAKKRSISTGAGCLIIVIAVIVIPLILSSVGVGKGTSNKSSEAPKPTVDVAAKQAQKELLSKVELVNPRIELNIIEQEEFRVSVKNSTGRDIDAIRFTGKFQNNFGEPVPDWSGNYTYRSGYQGVIKAGASEQLSEQLVTWRSPTKVVDLQIIQVHFVDGEDISLE